VIAIVDAGPLYAGINANDRNHIRSAAILERPDLELVVPALVVAEVAYLAGRRLGPTVESRFVRGLNAVEVEAPTSEDWAAIADLVERYADFPLGTTDASVAVLADRLETELILTLDRRHFGALRSAQGRPYQLLPD
jgi:predicted nucleic acid-binding protein